VKKSDTWHPSGNLATWKERARLLRQVREFFHARGVLEVETPVLARTTVTDPAIDSLEVAIDGHRRYLQTSPEYHMKRLLAAGAPSIYRLGPVFRADESGRQHNPEFTMIEWYRLGFSAEELMAEVADLVDLLIGADEYRRVAYDGLLVDRLGVSADAGVGALRAAVAAFMELPGEVERRDLLDLAFATALSNQPGRCFINDYPADQAALAATRIDEVGREVAERFELVIDGLEIANGYHELTDAEIMAQRMDADRRHRKADGRGAPAPDDRLLAAMRAGLPHCAGVAVGFDRLVMLATGATRIDQVLTFPFDRA
jgi:lysyl-tRNA synthetase class 2